MDYNTCTIGLNGVRTACASADEPAAWIVYAQYTPGSLAGIGPRFAKLTDMRPPNADVSIYKAFPIREKIKFELTGQAFNLTNSPWFGSGDNGAGANGSLSTLGTFGTLNKAQGNTARTVQVAGKLSWQVLRQGWRFASWASASSHQERRRVKL